MKRTLLVLSVISFSMSSFAQQIGNADLEQWETVVTDQEPVNWNSFLTAGGLFASAAANQIESSSDVRPGSPGTKSARLWSREVFGIVANGNMTLGKINMGAAQADNPANYNETVRTDANFSQAMTTRPDSIVFWAKYVPVNATGNEARMKASLHGDYNCKDPEDAASVPYIAARAVVNFSATNGWQRISVPFVYEAGVNTNNYLLVTFATNKTPGGGTANDQLWIDDIELIYNPVNVEENTLLDVSVFMDDNSNELNVNSEETLNGTYSVLNLSGQVVQSGTIESKIPFNEPAGMYIVRLEAEGKFFETKIVKK